MDTNALFLIAQKARALQHNYLCGVKITAESPKEKMLCPCGSRHPIWWYSRDNGECFEKCGHCFIVKWEDVEKNGETITEKTVYCKKTLNGHEWAIGELVGVATKQMKRFLGKQTISYAVPDIPIDSPYFDILDDVDALYMVIGVDLSGDRIAISPMENGELAGSTNPDLAADVAAGIPLDWQQPFWVPIELIELRSQWPFIEEE